MDLAGLSQPSLAWRELTLSNPKSLSSFQNNSAWTVPQMAQDAKEDSKTIASITQKEIQSTLLPSIHTLASPVLATQSQTVQ